jgi:WD40 repeat protein
MGAWRESLAACLLLAVASWAEAGDAPKGRDQAEAEAARAQLRQLKRLLEDPAADPGEVWKGWAEMRAEHPGTPEWREAAALVARVRSPLDRLELGELPAEERFPDLPEGLAAVLGSGPARHWGRAGRVTLSPDGKTLASASVRVRLWDAATLRPLAALEGHANGVTALAFSADGKRLASGGWDGELRVWDLGGDQPKNLGSVQGHAEAVRCLGFSPDGKTLASGGSDALVKLWDVSGDQPKERATLRGHEDRVVALAFRAGGKGLVSVGEQRSVRVWDLSGDQPRVAGAVERADQAGQPGAVSADGTMAAAYDDEHKEVRLWDVSGDKPKQLGSVDRDLVGGALALAADGKALVTATFRDKVEVWDLTRTGPQQKAALKAGGEVLGVFTDGRRVALAGPGFRVSVWDPEAKPAPERKEEGHGARLGCLAFSPNGATLATGGDDEAVRLWGLGGARPEVGPVLRWEDMGKVEGLAFGPDAGILATVGWDRVLRLWDLTGRPPKQKDRQGAHVGASALAAAADGRTLATAGYDKAVRLWRLADDRLQEGPAIPDLVTGPSLALSPDGKVLAAGCDKALRRWDVSGEKPRELPPLEAGAYLPALAFCPDGKTLVAGCSDGAVRRWDVAGEKAAELPALKGHGGYVRAVAFSPDGALLAAAEGDGWVLVWDREGKAVKEWRLGGPVSAVAFAPDSRHLATANGNGTAYVLRLAPPAKAPGK